MSPVQSLMFWVSPYIEHLYAGTESERVHIWDLMFQLGHKKTVDTDYCGNFKNGNKFEPCSLCSNRSKKILSSLEVEQYPMSVDYNATLMHGIVGSPCANLEWQVADLHAYYDRDSL
ncbi:hypothetical protein TSAR_006698 [Trichomalopsis sarcophagae]|uniref:Uncharacterized protein n=1 Tax=Trichomalopsis sarcophagae TaxID=543379 RepID=A0A232F098_9HYME|nr:hypothetical protein TSAR_006698 [Trichomalopsis sarcophagae]